MKLLEPTLRTRKAALVFLDYGISVVETTTVFQAPSMIQTETRPQLGCHFRDWRGSQGPAPFICCLKEFTCEQDKRTIVVFFEGKKKHAILGLRAWRELLDPARNPSKSGQPTQIDTSIYYPI